MAKKRWQRLPLSNVFSLPSPPPPDSPTDTNSSETAPQQPIRTMNMNAYGSQPSRQTPRLQNTQKTAGLGNVLAGGGWGMGLPAANGASGSAFGPPVSTQPRLSGFAQVMGGGGGQGPIDMSEFPTLSGGPRAASNNNQGGVNWNSSAVRAQPSAPPAQQHSQHSQQRAPSAAPSQQSLDQFDNQRANTTNDRAGSGEEFPPLGGQVNGDAQQNFSSLAASPDSTLQRTSVPSTQLPIRESSGFQGLQQGHVGSGQQHQHTQQSQTSQNMVQPSSAPSSGMKKYIGMTEGEKYGMLGLEALLNARRNIDAGLPHDTTLPVAELNGILMGQDVSVLGLDLDSPDPILPTFTPFPSQVSSGSQFNYHDQFTVPEYTLPSAYTVTNVPQISSRISAMSDGDNDQELAAMELSAREWRWHKVLRQWLQKDSPANLTQASAIVDLATNTPVGTQPVRVAERVERGVYVFFDPTNWRRERREFTLDYDQLDFRSGVQPPAAGPGTSGGNTAQQGSSMGIPPGMMGGGVGAVGGSVGGAVGSGHGGSSQIQGT
nr:isoform 3 of ccr4-not transcription complex subunit 2 [Quercus suber]POF00909.1 isoform 3 of ccr4-not transcription complex subunit 2 [Quercus suber]